MLFGYTLMFDVFILYKIFLLNSMVPMEQYVYYIVIYIQYYIYRCVYISTYTFYYIYIHIVGICCLDFCLSRQMTPLSLFFWLNVIINTDCIPIVIDTPIIKIPLIFP